MKWSPMTVREKQRCFGNRRRVSISVGGTHTLLQQVQIRRAGCSFVIHTIALGAFKGCIGFYVCVRKKEEVFLRESGMGNEIEELVR